MVVGGKKDVLPQDVLDLENRGMVESVTQDVTGHEEVVLVEVVKETMSMDVKKSEGRG